MNISISCVTETWFQKKNGTFSKRIRDAGFTLHHSFRENKRGGGCAIMYKKHLLLKKGDSSSTEYLSFEYAYIILSIMSGRKVVIICIYRKQEVMFSEFIEECTSFMDKIRKIFLWG